MPARTGEWVSNPLRDGVEAAENSCISCASSLPLLPEFFSSVLLYSCCLYMRERLVDISDVWSILDICNERATAVAVYAHLRIKK